MIRRTELTMFRPEFELIRTHLVDNTIKNGEKLFMMTSFPLNTVKIFDNL